MKIHNTCPYKISTDIIRYVINLLPSEYKNISIPIYIFSNSIVYNTYNIINCFSVTYDECAGFMNYYNHKPKAVVIFYKKGMDRLKPIYNMYHELRHVYQASYMDVIFKRACNNYVSCNDEDDSINEIYRKQFIEIDAERFVLIILLNDIRSQLSKILNMQYQNVKFPDYKIKVKGYKEL